jgi:Rhodopirellula transposase DDE domain
VASFRKSGDPVLSVDTKKKELVGPFKNRERTWRPKGDPHRVNVHDFPSQAEGQAIPYGAYEIGEDRAVVKVGVTYDTVEFGVESIRRWWKLAGRQRKPEAPRILICADAGGSNSSRSRAWKLYLQELADDLALPITVCR